MNSDAVQLVTVFFAGGVLGLFHFGGLWLTVRGVNHRQHPASTILASFVGRIAIVLAVFYFLMDGRWERLAVCLVAFLIARQVIIYRISSVILDQESGNKRTPA